MRSALESDITHVRLKSRFVYVSLLMDVFIRRIRGSQVSQHLMQPLTLKPLQQALCCWSVPEIHHSDQGVQYLSNAYISLSKHHSIEISVTRRERPWEDGYAERLIPTLKEEEVHLNDYEDIHEAKVPVYTAYGFLDHSLRENCPTINPLIGCSVDIFYLFHGSFE